MTTAGELRNWLARFNPDDPVGIDEGGLTLHAINVPISYYPDDYYEVGGIPEEIMLELKHEIETRTLKGLPL
jgi:hypothetical protein